MTNAPPAPGSRSPVLRFPSILFLLVILIQLPVPFSHENYLLTWFNIDDGFYYFVTARNIAAGLGVTFDGVAPTNGFHPLWMALITPIFALPGQILPLRVLAFVLILLNAAAAALLCRLAARQLAPWPAFFTGLAFALLPPIHDYTARGGMEAGLSAFLMVLLLHRAATIDPADLRDLVTTGAIGALAFLARLDNVFLAGFVGLVLVLKSGSQPDGNDAWRRRIRRAAAYFVPLVLVVGGYMLWSQVGFGTPTPVSGQVKRWWGTLENSPYGFPPKQLANYIGQFVTDDVDIGPWSLATAPLYDAAEEFAGTDVSNRRIGLAIFGLFISAFVGLLAWSDRRRMPATIAELGLVPLLLGCLVQIGYYKIGGSVAQRPWYWIGEMLWLVLAGGVLLDMSARLIAGSLPAPGPKRATGGIVTLVLAVLLIQPHLPRMSRIFSPDIAQVESFYHARSDWLETHTEPGASIGMTGTGSAAYFTEGRTLINLDGLIGSYEYFLSLQDGTADEYLESIGLDYVFGIEYILTVSDPYGEIFAGRLEAVDVFEAGEQSLGLWRFTR